MGAEMEKESRPADGFKSYEEYRIDSDDEESGSFEYLTAHVGCQTDDTPGHVDGSLRWDASSVESSSQMELMSVEAGTTQTPSSLMAESSNLLEWVWAHRLEDYYDSMVQYGYDDVADLRIAD